MQYKNMNPLGGLRRRQQQEQQRPSGEARPIVTNPSPTFYNGGSNLQPTMSPLVFRAPRDYEIAVNENPVRYAVINAPFLKLRQRTESLLDVITGGTLPAEVLEQERRQKDMERQLKCRGCKVVFGSEEGLNGHLRLFPAHVNAPEYKRKQRRSRKHRHRRSHSTSDVASSAASITSSRRSGRHGRSNTIALPVATKGSHLHTLQQKPATAPRTFEEAVELVRERNELVRPSAPRALPDIPMVQPEWPDLQQENINTSTAENTASNGKPSLPPLDFGSFQDISIVGARSPPLARPIPIKDERVKPLIDYEERNVKAGAYAALRSISQREEEQLRRKQAKEQVTIPPTFSGAVKAVFTGNQPERAPSMPSSPHSTKESSNNKIALTDVTNRESIPPPLPPKSAMKRGVLTVRNPSPQNDSDDGDIQSGVVETTKPISMGVTSFSDNQQESATTKESGSLNMRKMLRRRSTNPFLNESFMNNLSPSAKTPPLSPSSPFSRLSPGNPFARVYESEAEDNADDFYDAPDTPPQMPASAPTFLRRRTNTNPFFASMGEEEEEAISSTSMSGQMPRSSETHSEVERQQDFSSSPSRGVHFEHQAAIKADDNPRCPSCRRAFIDLNSVLYHLERSSCNQLELNEGQMTEAR